MFVLCPHAEWWPCFVLLLYWPSYDSILHRSSGIFWSRQINSGDVSAGDGGAVALAIDHFYKDEDECPRLDNRPHWDLPESLHMDELYEALVELKTGEDIEILSV